MKRYSLIIAALLILGLAPSMTNAQVTMGSLAEPHQFSVLELISNQSQGLRLPQMDTGQRDEMTKTDEFQSEKEALAKGLMIYNTDIDCIEYWNGEEWLMNCGTSIIDLSSLTISPTYNTYSSTSDVSKLYTGAVFARGSDDSKVRGTGITYDTPISAGYFHYQGANGEVIPEAQYTHASGVVVIVPAITLNEGDGIVEVQVRGTPDVSYAGKAFDIPINWFGWDLTVRVNTGCGVYTVDKFTTNEDGIATYWAQWQCFNLGADVTRDDPFAPDASLHGNKYQWGNKGNYISMADDQESAAAPDGWTSNALSTAEDWNMVAENPCDAGWRVPTHSELGFLANMHTNTQSARIVGEFPISQSGNYKTGVMYGDAIMLPTAAARNSNGVLFNDQRGGNGYYWTITTLEASSSSAYSLSSALGTTGIVMSQMSALGSLKNRLHSVRCIAIPE